MKNSWMRFTFGVALASMLAACGSSSSNSGGSGGGGGGAGGAGGSGGAGGTGGSGGAGNTIMGTVNGMGFNTVQTALWIGKPDSATTTVVYMFSNAVNCADIGAPGWDGRITDKTQVLEMKAFGTTPMMYTVTSPPTPAPGEASVNHSLTPHDGTSVETIASG